MTSAQTTAHLPPEELPMVESTVQAVARRPAAPAAVAGRGWHYLSHIVVRRTGFPFDWLEELASPAAEEAARAVAADRAGAAALTETTLRSVFPAAVRRGRAEQDQEKLRALSKLRRRFATGHLGAQDVERAAAVHPALGRAAREIVGLRQRAAAGMATLRTRLDEAAPAISASLARRAADSDVRAALFLTNPELYRNSIATLPPGQPGRPALQRKLWAYLQRFCAKNDTASFFGPLNYARIRPGAPQPVVISTEGHKYTRRDVFFSFWVVKVLAEAISADPTLRPLLRPRLHPLCRLEGEALLLAGTGRRVPLGPVRRAVLTLADGTRTAAQIASCLSEYDVPAEIGRLVETGALICRLDVPSTIFHPFDALRRAVEELPPQWPNRDRWVADLAAFDALRQGFRDGTLAERDATLTRLDAMFSTLTGLAPRRKAGATYADRTLFYEECLGTMTTFDLDADFFADCAARMAPILDLCAAHGSLLQEHYRDVARGIFTTLSPSGAPVPYSQFAAAVRRAQEQGLGSTLPTALTDLVGALRRLVEQRTDGHVARLRVEDVSALLAASLPPALATQSCHVSPDVMFAAPSLEALRAGEYQLVLGEVHQVMYVWGSQLYFHPERADAERETRDHLAHMPEYTGLATLLKQRQHKGLLSESFAGTFIEVGAPPRDGRARLAVSEVQVALDGDELVLRSVADGSRLRLYTAGDDQLHLWAFAVPRAMPIPVRTGSHTPRIELDGAVYQRERWQLDAQDWGPDLADLDLPEFLVRCAEQRRRFGIPRRVFLLAPSEPKPVYLDFATPVALRLFQQLLLQNTTVTLTEMLPDPDELWLQEPDGRYCIELRMTAHRYGADPGTPA